MFAFVFDSVSGGEWLVLLAVILIIVGPKNLPSAARKVGEIMSKLRRAADEFKRQLMTMDEEMRKTADDIKKEYIDIPEDTAEHDAASDESYDYGSDYPGYPEEDYYGMDDSGEAMDDSGAVMDDSAGDTAQESAQPQPAQDPAPEASENNNG